VILEGPAVARCVGASSLSSRSAVSVLARRRSGTWSRSRLPIPSMDRDGRARSRVPAPHHERHAEHRRRADGWLSGAAMGL